MSQSYNYTPNPVVYGSTFNLTFTDNTGTINGNNTYNLQDTNSNVLASYDNTTQVFVSGSPIVGPNGLAIDSSDNFYVTNFNNSIKVVKVLPNGSMSTYTNNGAISVPGNPALDPSGNLYVPSYNNNSIVKVTPNGTVTTIASSSSGINRSQSVTFYNGFVYVANQNSNNVLKISPDGSTVTTFVSNVSSPRALAFSRDAYLYVASYGNNVIYKISPDGSSFTTFASGLSGPTAVVFDLYNNLFVANFGNYTISKISPTGTVTTFASNSFSSNLNSPTGLVFDSNNNLYVSNYGNAKISLFKTYILPFTNATSNTLINDSINNLSIKYGSSTLNTSNISINVGIPCFLKGTNILTDKGYVPIENLKIGDLIQTLYNGFVPIYLITNKQINNNDATESLLYRLYKYSKNLYPELLDDLIITGGHSILVDEFISEKQKNDNDKLFGCTTPLVDGKHCLLACNDEKAVLYEKEDNFTIYHLALENDNEYGEYGIFANGLLVESCNIHFLKKFMVFS